MNKMKLPSNHIAIFGNFGTGNLGNEASLRAMLDLLYRTRPNARVTVVCYGVEAVEQEHSVNALSIRMDDTRGLVRLFNRLLFSIPLKAATLLRAIYFARQVDIFLVPGTGILDDFQERWKGMPFDLWLWSTAVRIARRPFAFVSIGAGPIRSSMSAKLMLNAARLASYRTYRDDISLSFMEKMKTRGPDDHVSADLVFQLPSPSFALGEHTPPSSKMIGVGVMSYRGWERSDGSGEDKHNAYLEKLVIFTNWLLDEGYRVRFLIGEFSDLPVVDDVIARLRVRRVELNADQFVAEKANSLEELMHQIADTEVVVATRYHNIVSALMMHKPVLSISYAAKNGALLSEAGLSEFQQEIEDLNVELLIQQFEVLMLRRIELVESVAAAVSNFRERLTAQENELLARLI